MTTTTNVWTVTSGDDITKYRQIIYTHRRGQLRQQRMESFDCLSLLMFGRGQLLRQQQIESFDSLSLLVFGRGRQRRR